MMMEVCVKTAWVSHLHHHGGVGHVCPPLLRSGPAHQGIGLVVVHGEVAKRREVLLDLPHRPNLLLEDGQGGPAPLQDASHGSSGGFLGTAPSLWLTQTGNHQAPAAAHLLVQSDVVDADALFSSEEVGAVVAVLQHRPAVRRPGGGLTRVARAPKSEQAAGGTQTLRAGVVIIQKAWRHRGEESNNGRSDHG